ncbi:MAG: hypothetical protein UU31_C0002G0032 [Candidatus Uhrbacteria bacterium GW2011_GWA2_41_10]|nr:MAG: hypothetical protein UU31_C0002G0032 [Candidatus Uhrbacteria bacterium GW2011_GWA2_41_10]
MPIDDLAQMLLGAAELLITKPFSGGITAWLCTTFMVFVVLPVGSMVLAEYVSTPASGIWPRNPIHIPPAQLPTAIRHLDAVRPKTSSVEESFLQRRHTVVNVRHWVTANFGAKNENPCSKYFGTKSRG